MCCNEEDLIARYAVTFDGANEVIVRDGDKIEINMIEYSIRLLVSDEEMEELRREAKEKLDALFGTVPPPNEEEDEDDGEAFQLATPEALAAEEASELAAEAEESEM